MADVDCISPAVGKRDTKGEGSALTPIRPQWRSALLDQPYHGPTRRQEAFTFAHPKVLKGVAQASRNRLRSMRTCQIEWMW